MALPVANGLCNISFRYVFPFFWSGKVNAVGIFLNCFFPRLRYLNSELVFNDRRLEKK